VYTNGTKLRHTVDGAVLQVGYYASTVLIGFKVHVHPATDDRSVLTQCMIGVDYVNASLSSEHTQRMRTCYTATVAKLRRGQRLQLQDISIENHRANVYLDDYSTNYFGVVLLRTINWSTLHAACQSCCCCWSKSSVCPSVLQTLSLSLSLSLCMRARKTRKKLLIGIDIDGYRIGIDIHIEVIRFHWHVHGLDLLPILRAIVVF